MSHPLTHSRARLQRGRRQLQTLEREITVFLEREPYRTVTDFEPKLPEHGAPWPHIQRAHIVEQPNAEWSMTIGEIVGNLRSALDYLVCAMTIENGNKVGHKTAYPLYDDAAKLSNAQKALIGGLPRMAQIQIVHWQPGRGDNQMVAEGLSVLALLSNFDKHQALHVVGSALSAADTFAIGKTGTKIPLTALGVHQGPFEDGDELVRVDLFPAGLDPNDQPFDIYTNLTFDVAFGEGGPCAGRPVIDTLRRAQDAVVFVTTYFEGWFAPGMRATMWKAAP